jgi:hypothetical protein
MSPKSIHVVAFAFLSSYSGVNMEARHRNAGYFFDAKSGRELTQFGGWEIPAGTKSS